MIEDFTNMIMDLKLNEVLGTERMGMKEIFWVRDSVFWYLNYFPNFIKLIKILFIKFSSFIFRKQLEFFPDCGIRYLEKGVEELYALHAMH